MTRREMLARLDSQELSGWWALFQVHHEESEHARHVAESGDGQVFEYGRETDEDDNDGPAE